ncbi:pyrrolysine biosynthesis protein PylC [Dethiosulfatibacter aminovorans DSM 17477]|uniref:Pyrrolysine biosynthesis protein PylC n=1 Tax=Dethiosulfatibacter aminovorans DSM 17477 TaxID=1121476 RepID=A0A1M6F4J6_9FIRM|nr:3-methylornithine--L-lysine ligase PylC [Dethiosulfatibacter aminovorans]SHI92591.1 pyrrolysine biosynthesis protein PylC [Dethiosulfatibacter aminovorans DSM 17477]
MYSLAIIGGKLQGVEAAYLAGKAGIRTMLVDKNPYAPARNLCDEFLCMDVLEMDEMLIERLKEADIVLPAIENCDVLEKLRCLSEEEEIIMAFDFEAFAVTASKKSSDRLFHKYDIPSPKYYPHCKAPYIVKPSSGSGSSGVKFVGNEIELSEILEQYSKSDELIVQEFLAGKSYSIEIIGKPGFYKTYEITEIIVDESYDCKRVTAPCYIPETQKEQLRNIAAGIAERIGLKGVMDVEVIDDGGIMKVLEIDARIPSQTPTVVYHCTGVNLVEELFHLFLTGDLSDAKGGRYKNVSYEHILVEKNNASILGEHIMGECEYLEHIFGLFGSDEVLTDYRKSSECWRGTFINVGDDIEEVESKRKRVRKNIYREEDLRV